MEFLHIAYNIKGHNSIVKNYQETNLPRDSATSNAVLQFPLISCGDNVLKSLYVKEKMKEKEIKQYIITSHSFIHIILPRSPITVFGIQFLSVYDASYIFCSQSQASIVKRDPP